MRDSTKLLNGNTLTDMYGKMTNPNFGNFGGDTFSDLKWTVLEYEDKTL